MTNISSLDASANHFGFTLQTSSGDTISLSMYDDKSVSFEAARDGENQTFSMSLRHEYGYTFHYDGNGIDSQDMKEIREAMKIVKPIFKEFLENVEKSGDIPGFKEMTNITQMLRDRLPEPKTPEMESVLKDTTVETMDSVLSLFKEQEKLLKSAKHLFDKLFDTDSRLDFFA